MIANNSALSTGLLQIDFGACIDGALTVGAHVAG
jgi:hypothetical protein